MGFVVKRERERVKFKDQNTNERENPWCTLNAAYKYTKRTCAHIKIMFPESNSFKRIVTESSSRSTHPIMYYFFLLWVWSVDMEIIDYKLNKSDISLHNCCY